MNGKRNSWSTKTMKESRIGGSVVELSPAKKSLARAKFTFVARERLKILANKEHFISSIGGSVVELSPATR